VPAYEHTLNQVRGVDVGQSRWAEKEWKRVKKRVKEKSEKEKSEDTHNFWCLEILGV